MITSDLFTNNSPALFENTGPVTHRIGLTVTDPNHPMVSKRKEPYQKSVRVTGNDREAAINQAIAHYRRKGYKVHDHHYMGTVDQGMAEGGIATVGWPDEGNSTRNNTPVSVGGTFDARPVVKRGSLVKASGLTGVYRVMDILRDEAKIVQEIPRTGQSTYVPMSDLRVWTNKPMKEQGMAEASLGDYRKKATVNKAVAQTNRFFDRDDPAKVAAADQTIAKREKGLARADARSRPYTAPPVDKEKQRQQLTDKYPNIDELVRRAELNRDPNYEYADGQAYYAARDNEQHYQKLKQIQSIIKGQQLDEISLDQIGTGIANVIGGVSKAAGAVAGVPQGIGRAVKKGYRGSVQGIGGADNSETDVPGAAYGDTNRGKEVPTATGAINPATNRPYVPSDFAATDEPTTATDAGDTQRTVDTVRQDIQSLDTAYKTRLKALQNELSGLQKGSASDQELSQAQQDYISAIGPDQPSGGRASAATDNAAPTAPAAAPSMARDPKVLNTLQNLDAKELQIIKKILQARARATNESELSEVAFGDVWRGTGDRLKNATSGIRSAASGAANMAKSAYKAAKPYVKKAGQIAAAVPGAVATGAGAVAGGVAGMKNAARKGYAAGQKHVGGGALTMDELQQAIGGMTADDAKQLLMFVKQLEIQNAPAKGKAKPKTRKPSATTLPSNTTPTTTTPTWTGRQTATEPTAVAESLTWSKKFDPGMTVYKRMKSGR